MFVRYVGEWIWRTLCIIHSISSAQLSFDERPPSLPLQVFSHPLPQPLSFLIVSDFLSQLVAVSNINSTHSSLPASTPYYLCLPSLIQHFSSGFYPQRYTSKRKNRCCSDISLPPSSHQPSNHSNVVRPLRIHMAPHQKPLDLVVAKSKTDKQVSPLHTTPLLLTIL